VALKANTPKEGKPSTTRSSIVTPWTGLPVVPVAKSTSPRTQMPFTVDGSVGSTHGLGVIGEARLMTVPVSVDPAARSVMSVVIVRFW
jgi:hypothetical protein